MLLDHGTRCAPLLNRAALAADARAGQWRDPNGVWRALNLELWLRAFSVRAGGPGASAELTAV